MSLRQITLLPAMRLAQSEYAIVMEHEGAHTCCVVSVEPL